MIIYSIHRQEERIVVKGKLREVDFMAVVVVHVEQCRLIDHNQCVVDKWDIMEFCHFDLVFSKLFIWDLQQRAGCHDIREWGVADCKDLKSCETHESTMLLLALGGGCSERFQ